MLNVRFEQPWFLLLALLAIPLIAVGYRALWSMDGLRRWLSLGLRAALVTALAVMLAGPQWQRRHNHLTVIGLLDISGSVQRFADLPPISLNDGGATIKSNIEYLRQWFRRATQTREPNDRFGLVVFDGRAIAVSAPSRGRYVDDNLDVAIASGTNIADAVRLGLAMFPADTAKRLVLVSDGNQTVGDVMEAVRQLPVMSDESRVNDDKDFSSTLRRSSLPIDVLPIAYNLSNDVQVVRIEAPPLAQPGQTVTVRIVLEAASPTDGALTLTREGHPVDLNGPASGTARHLAVPAGQSAHLADVVLGQTPINRFKAVFEADNPADDVLPDNDWGEAFTATPSKGSVLIVDGQADGRDNVLAEILATADMPAIVQAPAQFPNDLLSLQNFDLVVLDNVGAYEISQPQQKLLSRYVRDLGGGLIMLGGDRSFGAGGWNGTEIEKVLPLELDPAKELRLPSAALVLVLDKSGSMGQPVAGARASQQQVANEGAALAIESLRSDSMVGVITFDMFSSTLVPLQRNDNPRKIADKVRAIQPEGGTNLEPALLQAFEMLRGQKVAKKRVVCLTDGRSHSTDNLESIAAQMAAENIQVTTIAVGDDADYETLEKMARAGGGTFYPVRDPRILPRVLVDSVQPMNAPLIKEVTFTPKVLPTGSTITAGMNSSPPLDGIVITSPRRDPTVSLEMVDPDDDPLLAHWQIGLGRVAAFTSHGPGAGKWSAKWTDWPTASAFWAQLARMTARPVMSQDAELITSIVDDRLHMSLEVIGDALSGDGDAGLAYLQIAGTVYQPDGTTIPVRLRQTAPGRYESAIDAPQAGNYIVALNPRRGVRQLAPVIGGTSRATSPEFRRYQSNIALLEDIVQATAGRRLDVNNPLQVNLFDRSGMRDSVSLLPAWKTILWWSLLLVLLDVACRRIAWDVNMVREAARQALARVRPSHVRAAEAAATLATLRQASTDAGQRREAYVGGFDRMEPIGEVASAAPQRPDGDPNEYDLNAVLAEAPTPNRRQQPDATTVTAALDALLGRGQAKREPAKPQSSTPADPNATAAETTSGLLAAKRRAQERLPRRQ